MSEYSIILQCIIGYNWW